MANKAKIFVVHNQKGGVGKSATSVNVSLTASQVHKVRTALVDIDAQKNSTNSVCAKVPREAMLASMLFAESFPAELQPIKINSHLDLIAGDKGLKNIDSLVKADDRQGRRELFMHFKRNIQQLAEEYDLIVIDTPTTAELRYMAALAAADYALSPTTLDAYGMDGIADTKETIRDIRTLYGNPGLRDFGLMPNKVVKRSKLHTEHMQQLHAAGVKVFEQTIYQRSDVENKLYEGKRSPVMRPAVDAILKGMGLV